MLLERALVPVQGAVRALEEDGEDLAEAYVAKAIRNRPPDVAESDRESLWRRRGAIEAHRRTDCEGRQLTNAW